MALVSGISNFFNQLSLFLGGSNSNNIWSNRRDSLHESRFKTASQLQQERNEFESFETLKNVFQERKSNQLNFIDSQIIEAQNFKIITPQFQRVGTLSRSVADYLFKGGSGNLSNPHNVWQINAYNIRNAQVRAFNEYKVNTQNSIMDFINNLQVQKSLIQSESVI